MNEWINSILVSDQTGIIILVALFLMGIISVFTCPCNFAVIGMVLGYTGTISTSSRIKNVVLSSLFFLLGTMVAMCLLGSLIVFAGNFISDAMGDFWKIGIGFICIFFGVYVLDIFPFKLRHLKYNLKKKSNNISGAILFGFIVGSLTSLGTLCCNPIFPIVVAASLVIESKLWSFLLLLTYAFGFGAMLAAIMMGLGFGIGKMSKLLTKSAEIIKYASGILLIILGFYLIITA